MITSLGTCRLVIAIESTIARLAHQRAPPPDRLRPLASAGVQGVQPPEQIPEAVYIDPQRLKARRG